MTAMFGKDRFGPNEEMFQITVVYGWFTAKEVEPIVETIKNSPDELIRATVIEVRTKGSHSPPESPAYGQ